MGGAVGANCRVFFNLFDLSDFPAAFFVGQFVEAEPLSPMWPADSVVWQYSHRFIHGVKGKV